VAEILVGYARCSATSQDVRAQLSALKQLGVTDEHLHTDRGGTGRNRERPGLTAALGAVRDGDVLVVTKLDRLGRSARDLHDIAAEEGEASTTESASAVGRARSATWVPAITSSVTGYSTTPKPPRAIAPP